MKKRIVIYEGDEYRAKIEKQKVTQDDLFYETYCDAGHKVKEISIEMDRFADETKDKASYKSKYWGMGNNIIAFCGRRGQGKTSAMLSFAKLLTGEIEVDGYEKDTSREYVVLDSIDPSSLETTETITRVLLSRLFFRIRGKIQKDGDFEDERSFAKRKREILKLFQKCYANIDYLKHGKINEWELDDLENIAQMGSSMEFKENLYELIKCFLEMSSKENSKQRYLVIPIDDADLATKKIFEISEDIRNYLSIPNVIILMAADCKRLEYAIYQSFLVEHKQLSKLQKKIDISDECYRMAMRYLEKILPNGHRIELPDMEALIAERHDSLLLEYNQYDSESKEYKNIIKEVTSACNDMQGQLLKMLYDRTGIVFLKNEDELHFFLPHRMRELTHFIKLLLGMDVIKWDLLNTGEKGKKEYNKLSNNLAEIKQYFIEHWCAKYLDAVQSELIRKIDIANRNKNVVAVYRLVRQYCDEKGKFNDKEIPKFKESEITYHRLIHEVIEAWLADEKELQQAICIYYTIFLNEWFIDSQMNENFEQIALFIEEPFEIPKECYQQKYANKYNVTRFRVEIESLKQFLTEEELIEGTSNSWLEHFCKPIYDKDANNKIQQFVEDVDDDRILNTDVKELEFDVLRPIMTVMLDAKVLKNDKYEEKTESNSEMETVSENEPNAKLMGKASYEILNTVKNILVNYDVQEHLRQQLINKYSQLKKRRRDQSWISVCTEFYNVIDSWTERAHYLEVKESLSELCVGYINNSKLLTNVFLSNKDNFEVFKDEYTENFERYINFVEMTLKELEIHTPEEGLVYINSNLKEKAILMSLIDVNNISAFDRRTGLGKIQAVEEGMKSAFQNLVDALMKEEKNEDEIERAKGSCREKLEGCKKLIEPSKAKKTRGQSKPKSDSN